MRFKIFFYYLKMLKNSPVTCMVASLFPSLSIYYFTANSPRFIGYCSRMSLGHEFIRWIWEDHYQSFFLNYFICVCVYVCVYAYACMHVCTCVYACVYVCSCMYACICMCACMFTNHACVIARGQLTGVSFLLL